MCLALSQEQVNPVKRQDLQKTILDNRRNERGVLISRGVENFSR